MGNVNNRLERDQQLNSGDPASDGHASGLTMQDYRRNFRLGVINGALVTVALAFQDPSMVLSWFLAQLGTSNILIGLVQPIRWGSSFMLQILVSGYLQRKPYKMPFYLTVAVFRCLILVGLALVVALIPLGSPWLVPGFFAIFIIYSLISGVIGLPFLDIVGKSILPSERGKFFGRRNLWGNLLVLGASATVGYLLTEPLGLVFPLNVAVIFVLASLFRASSSVVWSRIKEPQGVVDTSRVRWSEQLRRGVRLLKRDPQYRRFVLVRLALVPPGWVTPFYVVYAQDELGIPPQMIGVYLAVRTIGAVLSNLVWSRMSDRRGNRSIVQAASALGISVPLLALIVGFLVQRSPAEASWPAYAFALVFMAMGAFGSGSMIAGMSYLLDIVPDSERSLYLGFNSTLFGIARFSALASGFLIDWFGFRALSALAVGFCVLSLVLSLGLGDQPIRSEIRDRRPLVPSRQKQQPECLAARR
ncbi:MAG: MFS transporter [Anaerolineae bacterium]|nr:MFS transporter [Anaerolineae bacterium]